MEPDRILFTSAPVSASAQEKKVYDFLDSLAIKYEGVSHEPADTIEVCHGVEKILKAEICKNLFLCNRQKTEFYLLLMPGDKKFKTKLLSKQINSSRLDFANCEYMEQYLGVKPGSVSVLGLINDSDNRVRLLIDEELLSKEYLGFHPCLNTSTLKIKLSDITDKFLPAVGHSCTAVNLKETED